MSNPFSSIPWSNLETLHKQAIDSMLADDALPVNCKLIYTGVIFEDCPDCIAFNPIGNKLGGSYYSGSPGPFTNTSNCPTCNGSQKIAIETSETVKMITIFNYRRFRISGVNLPEGGALTFSKRELLPKIKNCAYVILDSDNEQYNRNKFVLDGTPALIGFGQNLYIYCAWKKI